MNSLAKDMVAGTETIWADTLHYGADFQNLNAWLKDLVKLPDMSGEQLCDKIIEEARQGSNRDETGFEATPTLVHYKLEKSYRPFETAFQSFGQELASAAENKSNSNGINLTISGTHGMKEAEFSGSATDIGVELQEHLQRQTRDLFSFTENVRKAIATGQLTDNSGALASSALALEEAQTRLISSPYLVSPIEGIIPGSSEWNSKGLNVYLPNPKLLDSCALSHPFERAGTKEVTNQHNLESIMENSLRANAESHQPGWNEFWNAMRQDEPVCR
jgi:hypothetical protein